MSFTCGNLSIFFSNVKETLRDMRQQKIYEADDKMINLIKDNYNVLQSLGCFGISLGFGDKTVSQVCEEQQVDRSEEHTSELRHTVISYAVFCLKKKKKNKNKTQK